MPAKRIELEGQRFGRLTVIEPAEKIKGRQWQYRVVCDCGTERIIFGTNLRSGYTTSCGCLRREETGKRFATHGHSNPRTPTYTSWMSMRMRCNNPNAPKYSIYGGRGITICDHWDSFENFLADMGERPEGTTLDRVNPDGNYEPANCRWATVKEQNNNKRNK